MEQYISLHITITEDADLFSEILIAHLNEIGFEMFETNENGCVAYINKVNFNESLLSSIPYLYNNSNITFKINTIEQKNWNQEWENNFDPVIVDTVFIHADFHQPNPKFKYNINIQPEMSFGTGHHETTSAIISLMLTYDFGQKTVCDMGSGTAILAILASQLGAKVVDAIDYDPNCVRNGLANVTRNHCSNITVNLGNATSINGAKYDVIIANINKNILLADVGNYAQALPPKGLLFVSGFYNEDLDDIKASFAENGLTYHESLLKNNWCAAVFQRL
jgi:ribosomal protein L11 methyltransferase